MMEIVDLTQCCGTLSACSWEDAKMVPRAFNGMLNLADTCSSLENAAEDIIVLTNTSTSTQQPPGPCRLQDDAATLVQKGPRKAKARAIAPDEALRKMTGTNRLDVTNRLVANELPVQHPDRADMEVGLANVTFEQCY